MADQPTPGSSQPNASTTKSTGAASLFDPNAKLDQSNMINPVTGKSLVPNGQGLPRDPMQSLIDYSKWAQNRLMEPTTRLDISGRPVDPNEPSDFDKLLASTRAQGHSWDHPELYTQGNNWNGPNEAREFNSRQVDMPVIDPNLTNASFSNQRGTGSVSHLQPDQAIPPATFGPNHLNAAQFFTGEQLRKADGTPNPVMQAEAAKLPVDQLAKVMKQNGITLPDHFSGVPEYMNTHFVRSDAEQQAELNHMLEYVRNQRPHEGGPTPPANGEQMGPPSWVQAWHPEGTQPTPKIAGGPAELFNTPDAKLKMRESNPAGTLKANGILNGTGANIGDFGTSAYDEIMKLLFGDNPHANDRFRTWLGPLRPAIQ